MAFMQEILAQNMPVWEDCAATPFVRQLQTGTLHPDAFRVYMVQDSIYLREYARVFGKLIYHAATLREMQVYYAMLGFVTEAESAVRLRWLQRFGMTEADVEQLAPLPENRQYMEYLSEAADGADSMEMLMAVLPCMLSYSYIFRKLAAAPESAHSPYWDFIEEYASAGYAEDCAAWGAFAGEKCEKAPAEKRKRLARIFYQGSLLELDFWGMADPSQMKEGV